MGRNCLREQPKDDTGASQDRKPDWEATDSNTNWVVAIDIESLRGPEEEHREEIGAGDESDHES